MRQPGNCLTPASTGAILSNERRMMKRHGERRASIIQAPVATHEKKYTPMVQLGKALKEHFQTIGVNGRAKGAHNMLKQKIAAKRSKGLLFLV